MQSPTPALITHEQIKSLDPRAYLAWGAKNFGQDNNGLTLRFKTSGLVKWKGWVEITLNKGTDLYDLKFFRIRKKRVGGILEDTIVVDEEVEGIYNDSLVEVIDRRVG